MIQHNRTRTNNLSISAQFVRAKSSLSATLWETAFDRAATVVNAQQLRTASLPGSTTRDSAKLCMLGSTNTSTLARFMKTLISTLT